MDFQLNSFQITKVNGLLLAFTFIISAVLFIFSILSIWESLSIGFCCFILIVFIVKLGNSISTILDSIIVLACLTCLLFPLFFYQYFNFDQDNSVMHIKSMAVSSNEYYSFVLPGIAMWAIGLKTSFFKHNPDIDTIKFNSFKPQLVRRNIIPFTLVLLSLISFFIKPLVANEFSYIFYLLSNLYIIAALYLFYSKPKYKYLYLFIAFAIMLVASIQSALFGDFIFLLFTSLLVISLAFSLSLPAKLSLIIMGLVFMFLIQSIKMDYRKQIWLKGSNPAYFIDLLANKIKNPASLFQKETLFPIAARFNEGWLIAKTMAYVPSVNHYANGETILKSFAAVIVPRFLWKNKPVSGGKANLVRFTGIKDLNYSMNIGPIGEAWANFGKIGGILFLFLYGLLFRGLFDIILKIIHAGYPTVILWLPLLFFRAIVVETDILTTLNSLVKTGILVFILYWLYSRVFKLQL